MPAERQHFCSWRRLLAAAFCLLCLIGAVVAVVLTSRREQEEYEPEATTIGDPDVLIEDTSPEPDGASYIAGIRVCTGGEAYDWEICGVIITVVSASDGQYHEQEPLGFTGAPAFCDEYFVLPVNDCVQYFDLRFTEDGRAVEIAYASKLDPTRKSIGWATGLEAGAAVDQSPDGCIVQLNLGFD